MVKTARTNPAVFFATWAPVGSRSAFSAGFTRDLAEVWADKGKAAMLYTAEKQPAVFFATCARLIGPEGQSVGRPCRHSHKI